MEAAGGIRRMRLVSVLLVIMLVCAIVTILECERSINDHIDFLSPTSVLHEIKNEKKGENVLLAGVFDGHAGTAASETVSCILPSLFTTELLAAPEATMKDALENSWATTCDTYRNGCDENGECSARYDAVEGILYAETGSKDLFGKSSRPIPIMHPAVFEVVLHTHSPLAVKHSCPSNN